MSYKSFVDLLFILLLSTMVMLTRSVQLGAADTAVARLGANAVSPINADEVEVVAVGAATLVLDGRSYQSTGQLIERLATSDHRAVLLVTLEADVRHHRVLEVWSALAHAGFDVKLGAIPVDENGDGGGA